MIKQVKSIEVWLLTGHMIAGILSNPAHAAMSFNLEEKQRQVKEAVISIQKALEELEITIEEEGGSS